MSMIGNLVRVSQSQRDAFHRNPESITGFLYPGAVGIDTTPKTGLLSRIFTATKSRNEPEASNLLAEEDAMDIEKAWHGLHFLFTGSDWDGDFPEGFLVSCGKEVGDVDVGYGPARSFSREEVQKLAAFLDQMNEAQLHERLDLQRMQELEIYPDMWADDTDQEEVWEYLADAFRRTKQFISETAVKNMALIVYLN